MGNCYRITFSGNLKRSLTEADCQREMDWILGVVLEVAKEATAPNDAWFIADAKRCADSIPFDIEILVPEGTVPNDIARHVRDRAIETRRSTTFLLLEIKLGEATAQLIQPHRA